MAIDRNNKTSRGLFAPVFYEHRTAAKKKEERASGQVSPKLRRRMGDALADLFDEFGPEIYSETILGLKDVILEKFRSGFEQMDSTIQEELGKRGVEESREHIRAWSDEIVKDVNHFGLDEVAGALEDYVGTLTAEFQQEDGEEGDDLLEVPEEDLDAVEEVEEEEVEEVPEEEDALDLETDEELDLGDLGLELPEEEATAQHDPTGGRRRRPARRQQRREAGRQEARRTRRPFVGKPVPMGDPVELEWDDQAYLYDEDENAMDPDDAYMQSVGIGSNVDLTIEGKYVDTFRDQESAEAFVAEWAKKNQFYPNLWYVNDHGNVSDPIPY